MIRQLRAEGLSLAEVAKQAKSTPAVVRRVVGKLDPKVEEARREAQMEVARRIDAQALSWSENHGPNDIIGICDRTQHRISLTKQDLVVYEVNWPKLLGDIANALGVEPSEESAIGFARTRLVGYFHPTAGYKFRVYFIGELQALHATNAIRAIAAHSNEPFVLLMPSPATLSVEGQQVVDGRAGCCLALSDAVTSSGPGMWTATGFEERVLLAFTEAHVPTASETRSVFFPTPSNARWCNVSLRFVDGHTLSVCVGTVSRVLHYTQVGMADGRSAKPTKQWELLRVFAKNGNRYVKGIHLGMQNGPTGVHGYTG